MRIIPAIDIINGNCVRLQQGVYQKKIIYDKNPVEVAKSFEDIGIKNLHLVDLDGAKAKKIVNHNILEQICSQTKLQVDFGGGIKTEKDLVLAFDCGAAQVTVGTIAIKSPELVEQWIREFGADRIILGADVRNQMVSVNGWQEDTEKNIFDFVNEYGQRGIKSVISTDIATDGMLRGPSFQLYQDLIAAFPQLNFIASGGVASLNDLIQLEKIGVDGVIIGKAIYENRITLKDLKDYVS